MRINTGQGNIENEGAQNYGHTKKFIPEKYSWKNYILQAEFFFLTDGVNDEQKKAILLSAGGNELFTSCKNVAQG